VTEIEVQLQSATDTNLISKFSKITREKQFPLFPPAPIGYQANGQAGIMILFRYSTMARPDAIQARSSATNSSQANAGPDRLMAVVEFRGSLRIVQNFTASADVSAPALSGVKSSSSMQTQPRTRTVPVTDSATGLSSLVNAGCGFWGAQPAAGGTQPAKKNPPRRPRPEMVLPQRHPGH